MKKIALEEHFMAPGLEEYWQSTMGNVDPAMYDRISRRLFDFGELRLWKWTKRASKSPSALAGPGRRMEPDRKVALQKARAQTTSLQTKFAATPNDIRDLPTSPCRTLFRQARSSSVACVSTAFAAP